MTTGQTMIDADENDRKDTRRLVVKFASITVGFFLFLIFLGIACYTTTMDVNNNVHVNWWWLAAAFFCACLFMYHSCIS